VLALSGEARFVAALMALTGVEWGALAQARRRDVDLRARTLHARGGKTKWRNRLVEILDRPDWAWAWPIVEAHVRTLTESAPLVAIAERDALREQTEACRTLGLPAHRLHDWRHTYAVNAIRRGDDHQAIKRQLGHAPNSTMLYTTYGAYIEEARRLEDWARRETRKERNSARTASSSASTPKTKREAGRRK
jgi:integrase